MTNWIPISDEIFPEPCRNVLVTVKDDSADSPIYYTAVGWYYSGIWVVENTVCHQVIAWMKPPKPYKEDKVRMVYEEIIKWHKIVTRPPTQKELKEFKEIYAEDPEYVFDCTMPDDGQDILVASYWGIDIDRCVIDDYGYGLEEHGDWDGINAWAEKPKYKVGEQE